MHIVLTIIGVLNLGLGIFIFRKKLKEKTNILFFLICLFSSIWTICLGVDYFLSKNLYSNHESLALVINKIIFVSPAFIPMLYSMILSVFPKETKYYKKIWVFVVFITIPFVIISYFVPLSIEGGEVIFNNLFDKLYSIFGISIIFVGILVGIFRISKYSGINKKRLTYLFVGIFLALFFGYIFNSLLPAFYRNLDYVYLGPLFLLLFIFLSSYSIVKYRLFDLRIVFRKGLTITLVLIIYSIFVFAIGLLFSGVFDLGANAYTLFTLLIIILLIIFTVRSLKKSLDKLFLKEYYDLSVQIENLKSEFEAESTLEKLAIRVAQKSRDVLEIDDVYFFVYDQVKDKYITQFPRLGEVIFSSEDKLVKAFVEAKKSIVEKEIDYLGQDFPNKKDLYQDARKIMKKLKIEVLIPLTLGGKYLGALGFGKQIDRELYSQDKIERLEDFAKKLSVALAGVVEYEMTVERIKKSVDNS